MELYENSGINMYRLIEFLEKYITTKFKNKLIILDNTSSYRNERIKKLVNKHNNILYVVLFYINILLIQLKIISVC